MDVKNFDFTQFITFETALPIDMIQDEIDAIFEGQGFLITNFTDVEEVKKDYFSDCWKTYSFELKKDNFLDGFMEWETIENVPKLIEEFVDGINEILKLGICDMRIIICSFAEKKKTDNEFVCISKNNLYEELFKMSPFSFVCPDNLIVEIHCDKGHMVKE